MTMNKFNLYNISRQRGQFQWVRGTYFQQKWKAKAAARGYHGEVIKEGQWENMFQHRIRAVVPMNVKYLARFDGAEQATGRGSGAHEPVVMAQALQKVKQKQIPYMAMTFAPAERRLDTAIFRALFASSARQARQFVIHGFVKVNGKKVCTLRTWTMGRPG